MEDGHERDAAVLVEVPVPRDAEVEKRRFCPELVVAERLANAVRVPDEELPLLGGAVVARAVGVLAREVASRRVGHLAVDPPHDVPRGALEERLAPEHPIRVHVRPQEKRVVVEHLLEVRNEPSLVGRVAVEASAEMIPDAALAHRLEREPRRVARRAAVPQEQLERHRVRELRLAAEPAVRVVDTLHQRARDALEELGARREGAFAAGVPAPDLCDGLRELGSLLVDLAAALTVGLGERLEDLREAGHPVAIRGREVGAREERLLLGRQEDGERPASASPHQSHDQLVDLIEVGTLLPIHFDAHEVLVHEPGDRLVLEALSLHDVAPVACRVADREEDGHITPPCLGERLFTPREPLHRIVCMLEQVRGSLRRETVRLTVRAGSGGAHAAGHSARLP